MSAADPEPAYYQAVEEFFVSRRGDPLFLTSADWLLVRRWRRAGIPLRVVLRGIGDALDGHAHSWGRRRKVGSLAYCAGEVDAARERWRRALRISADEGLSTSGFMEGTAAALEASVERLGQAGRAAAAAVARELRARAGEPEGDLEDWLRSRESLLVEAVAADAGPQGRARLEEAVERDLGGWRGRMPDAVLADMRMESRARRLLEAHGLPRLSLLHL